MGDRREQQHHHKPLYQSECIKDPSHGDAVVSGGGGGRGGSSFESHKETSSYQHRRRTTHHHTVTHTYSSCEEEEISKEEEERKSSSWDRRNSQDEEEDGDGGDVMVTCEGKKKKKKKKNTSTNPKKKNGSSCWDNNSQDDDEDGDDGVMVTCEGKKKKKSTNPKKKKGGRCESYDDDDQDGNNSGEEEEVGDDCGGGRPQTVKEIKFLSHPHPLTLDNKKGGTESESCVVCARFIDAGKYYYWCDDCPFPIHKTCFDLPRKIRHDLFPGVTLELTDERIDTKCSACDHAVYFGFWYRSSSRNINLDAVCAGLPLTTHCDSQIFKYRLQLCYDFPISQAPDDWSNDIGCGICNGRRPLNKLEWTYYNETTGFIAHTKCVAYDGYVEDFEIALKKRLDHLSLP